MTELFTKQELLDYQKIKQWFPEASNKQTLKLKQLIELGRSASGCKAEDILLMFSRVHPDFWGNLFAGIKSAFTKAKNQAKTPTCLQETGQMFLFHPEAFQGGGNKTVREIQEESDRI